MKNIACKLKNIDLKFRKWFGIKISWFEYNIRSNWIVN